VVVVETVFGVPGLGQLTIDSILNKDLPVIQGVVPVMVVVAVVANLLADLLNLVLNPKLASVA
jgi:peptide/nickel transport system permease protein